MISAATIEVNLGGGKGGGGTDFLVWRGRLLVQFYTFKEPVR